MTSCKRLSKKVDLYLFIYYLLYIEREREREKEREREILICYIVEYIVSLNTFRLRVQLMPRPLWTCLPWVANY